MPELHQSLDLSRFAWIPSDIQTALRDEAEIFSPLETGGVLLGYWAVGTSEAVVTRIVGAGPDAIHRENHFVPDYEFQETDIARHYEESGRKLEYLGDWHSHPGGQGYLSDVDRKTLLRIGKTKSARVEEPLMLVLAGGPEWTIHAWQAVQIGWWRIKLHVIREVSVSIFANHNE